MVRWALLGGLVWLIGAVPVVAGEVTALRSSPEGEATRVVIETRTPAAHRLFTLTNPEAAMSGRGRSVFLQSSARLSPESCYSGCASPIGRAVPASCWT